MRELLFFLCLCCSSAQAGGSDLGMVLKDFESTKTYSYEFGDVPHGEIASISVYFTNRTSSILNMKMIRIWGDDFASTNNCPSRLARDHRCTIKISFKPRTIGLFSGHLQIDASKSKIHLYLTGWGI